MSKMIDKIWNEIETVKTTNAIKQIEICSNCDSLNLINDNDSIICKDCGLILSDQLCLSNYNFEESIDYIKKSNPNNKITKMQKWMEFTNEEKNLYKLKQDTRILCEKLEIYDNLIESITEMVINIMNHVKKNDGPKRSRVKDGIIIICIYYISKKYNCNYSYISLAQKINLSMKYVTKADRILMEIMNCDASNSLQIDKNILFKQEEPIRYIKTVIIKYNLNDALYNKIDIILHQTEVLINICKDNDLLIDHIPLSVGVCCFYYILKMMNIDINMNLFLKMFNLTNITIIKIYSQLQEYDEKLHKMLNKV